METIGQQGARLAREKSYLAQYVKRRGYHIISARAEVTTDITTFIQKLPSLDILPLEPVRFDKPCNGVLWVDRILQVGTEQVPKAMVEFITSLTVEDLRNAMITLNSQWHLDIHVMLQSLRECWIEDNSGERDFIQPK